MGIRKGYIAVAAAFSEDEIRKRLKNDEDALALVLTSTRLESILTKGLRDRLDADEEQFEVLWGTETLGTYGHMCSQLEVFGSEFNQKVIDDIANLRNKLVHEFGYLRDLEEDEDLQEDVEVAVEEALDFIDSVED